MTEASVLDPQDIAANVVRALVLYSLAEFQAGHATTIRVTADGYSFGVADDGRGHAIDRTVAGLPYLQVVYTHLEYPFEQRHGAPVQLHAIGMSLINVLCSELAVVTHKQDVRLRMSLTNGRLCEADIITVKSEETGNAISRTINQQLQKGGVDTQRLQQWLVGLLTARPALKLFFNGLKLHALPQRDA